MTINAEKDKVKVHIISGEGLSIKGFVYIDQGMRLNDFLNSRKDDFLAITEAKLKGVGEFLGMCYNREVVFINKNYIKLVEECKECK